MDPRKLFLIAGAVVIILAVSAIFSFKKMHEVPRVLLKADVSTVVVEAPKESSTPTITGAPGPSPALASCKTQPEFLEIHRELGLMINKNSEIRRKHSSHFLKLVNDFRGKFGLPFPLAITSNKAEENGIVYNNCKSACRGTVNVVFASRLVAGKQIEVLTKNGQLKIVPLHGSGIEVLSVDELNLKGVPFRTWRVPVASEWYISGNNLLTPLDIEGLWLRVDLQSRWEVVFSPVGLERLETAEPAAKVAGCSGDEMCFQTSGKRHRSFKAPKFCDQVVRHAQDEPSDTKTE